jgi:1,2-phenylacetyl-CoA epoxidase PaaB subunit
MRNIIKKKKCLLFKHEKSNITTNKPNEKKRTTKNQQITKNKQKHKTKKQKRKKTRKIMLYF